MKFLSNFYEESLACIKLRRRFIVFASIILLTIGWIYYPVIHQSCHIETGNRLLFEVPKDTVECMIVLDEPVNIQSYKLFLSNKGRKRDLKEFFEIDRKVKDIDISKKILSKYKSENFEKYCVDIYNSSNKNIKITEVYINGLSYDLKKFFEENIKIKDKVYVNREYTREYISKFMINYNDVASNFIITGLFIWSFYLFIQIIYFNLICRMSDNKFNKYIIKKFKLLNLDPENIEPDKIQIAVNSAGEIYIERGEWFKFVKVLGPAVGFMLTVTSLIAALHPSIQQQQNISAFFGAMQVAMVSTFVGLIIRILSIFLERANDNLFNRMDIMFTSLKS